MLWNGLLPNKLLQVVTYMQVFLLPLYYVWTLTISLSTAFTPFQKLLISLAAERSMNEYHDKKKELETKSAEVAKIQAEVAAMSDSLGKQGRELERLRQTLEHTQKSLEDSKTEAVELKRNRDALSEEARTSKSAADRAAQEVDLAQSRLQAAETQLLTKCTETQDKTNQLTEMQVLRDAVHDKSAEAVKLQKETIEAEKKVLEAEQKLKESEKKVSDFTIEKQRQEVDLRDSESKYLQLQGEMDDLKSKNAEQEAELTSTNSELKKCKEMLTKVLKPFIPFNEVFGEKEGEFLETLGEGSGAKNPVFKGKYMHGPVAIKKVDEGVEVMCVFVMTALLALFCSVVACLVNCCFIFTSVTSILTQDEAFASELCLMSQLSKNPLLVRCYGAIDPKSTWCISIDESKGKPCYKITNDASGSEVINFSSGRVTGIVMGEFLIHVPVFIALCPQAY